jgi:hypothetical protein
MAQKNEPAEDKDNDRPAPGFSEALAAAAQQSGLGKLKPGEAITGRVLLGAVGGIRGVIESVLPGIAFLILFLTTQNLAVSVIVPIVIALVFIVARAGARSSMTSAVAGAVLLAIAAILALVTNKAVTNFVPGMIINAVGAIVLLVSLAVRWPLIGAIVGFLYGDVSGWRGDRTKRRTLTIATWLWVALFVIRLALEVPLYLANDVAALAIVRIITSVPLYALVLWITWLLVRGVYAATEGAETPEDSDSP